MSTADYLRDPSSWIMSAQVQFRAARVLNDKLQARFAGDGLTPEPGGGGTVDELWSVDMELFKPIYMLGALSLELMFKGAIVCRDPAAIDDNGNPDWRGSRQGHALRDLATRSEIPDLDFDLLADLEPFITWKSRYPADRETFYEPPSFRNFAGTTTTDVLASIDRMFSSARAYIKTIQTT